MLHKFDRLFLALSVLLTMQLEARKLEVGPGKKYAKPSLASVDAQNGDTVEIAAGLYNGDVTSWRADNLVLRGSSKYAHLAANGKNEGGKAIWVIGGKNTVVENIEFSGASVPDQNGAGIRQEGPNVIIRHCFFHDNENGILGGDGGTVLIENSEFARNGFGDGQSHNIYIGYAKSFTLRNSYSHDAKIGHLVKTRADTSYILYNRIMDEVTGTASYEIDIPEAGTSYIIGNLIRQSPNTDNPAIIAYGEEPLTKIRGKDLYVINNTIINNRAGSSDVFVSITNGMGKAKVMNNLFIGGGRAVEGPSDTSNNLETANAGLVNIAIFDFHLLANSAAINQGANPGTAHGFSLMPAFQYVHPLSSESRQSVGTIDIGAYEFGNQVSIFSPYKTKAKSLNQNLFNGMGKCSMGKNPVHQIFYSY